MFLMIVAFSGIAAGAGLALFFVLSLYRALIRIIDDLFHKSGSLEKLSTKIAASSQRNAEGTTESAASLEEISSNMEDLASKTRFNADRASDAHALVAQIKDAVDNASASMKEVIASMEGISVSGNAINKIVKTIDEIAYQTNLLALNASVEAARAGDAGAGFAVVADEVRNLAHRSAVAAKSTASLVESTIQNINSGSQMVRATDDNFNLVIKQQAKLNQSISDVSSACSDQSQGIEQIKRALMEIDTVTQNNSKNTEETAATAEYLLSESDHVMQIVLQIKDLTYGRNGSGGNGQADGKDDGWGKELPGRLEAGGRRLLKGDPKGRPGPWKLEARGKKKPEMLEAKARQGDGRRGPAKEGPGKSATAKQGPAKQDSMDDWDDF